MYGSFFIMKGAKNMKEYLKPFDEVLNDNNTSGSGLTSVEAKARL